MNKTVFITHNGVTGDIQSWSSATGIKPSTLRSRISKGWSPENVLTKGKHKATRACAICESQFHTPPSSNKTTCSKACSDKRRSSAARKHGCEPARLYNIWCGMKHRCKATSALAKKYYSHVSVCKEWNENFEAFRDWSLANGYSEILEIDRIDNCDNYGPSNCRWATRAQQMRNTRVRTQKNKTSIYRGVARISHSKENSKNLWRANWWDGVNLIHLGVFATEEEAARAYDTKSIEVFGSEAVLNFKDDTTRKVG